MTTFADQVFQNGGVPVQGAPFFGAKSKSFFVDPVNGSDGNRGNKPSRAFSTLYKAHAMCTAGNNDVVYLIGNGANSGTARLSTALAQGVDSTATVGTLVWSKNATHLIGISAPSTNTRARISNVTTSTLTTFASGNLVSVTASGCNFSNFSVFQGFATGGASEIAWTDSGGRNSYNGVIFLGGGDAGSANSTTFRSLLISGDTGENVFRDCVIGLDTVARGNLASVEMEISGGSPRNAFYNCKINTLAKNTGACWLNIPSSGINRQVLFNNCTFFNPVLPASGAAATQMSVGILTNAAAGGVVLTQNCLYYGAAVLGATLVFSNLPAANGKGGLGVVAA